jgi:hypothetical protein
MQSEARSQHGGRRFHFDKMTNPTTRIHEPRFMLILSTVVDDE